MPAVRFIYACEPLSAELPIDRAPLSRPIEEGD